MSLDEEREVFRNKLKQMDKCNDILELTSMYVEIRDSISMYSKELQDDFLCELNRANIEYKNNILNSTKASSTNKKEFKKIPFTIEDIKKVSEFGINNKKLGNSMVINFDTGSVIL